MVIISKSEFVYDFGLRLRELRTKRKLTQKEVAERLDVSRNTISGYENNTVKPPLENLLKMAIMYNSSIDYIMGIDDRTNLYIDDLPESKQKMMIEIYNVVRREFEKNKN